MSKDALKILENHKKIVWPEIQKYFSEPEVPEQFQIKSRYKNLVDYHWEIVTEYPRRKGKYLRPTLLMLTGKAMGCKDKELIKTAAAMQTSEEWILCHDDIEDGSLLRRGEQALHKKYGVELATNAGDALHTLMWKMLIDNAEILGEKKSLIIMNEFFSILFRTSIGQTIEVKWFKEKKQTVNDQDWNLIADSKSAFYSIAAPLRLGAIIANATEKQLYNLTEFSLYLGRAFQLVDDILDLTTNFGGLKEKGNDIYEGKRTLILGHLLRNSTTSDQNRVLEILDKDRTKNTVKEVEWVISQMMEKGSIEYARSKVKRYKVKFLKILENDLKFLSIQPYKNQIYTLSSFVVDRNH